MRFVPIFPIVPILLLAWLATSAFSQERIFRADPIDLKQDERLDAIESRIEKLVESLKVVGDKLDRNDDTLVGKSVLDEAPKPIEDPVPNAESPISEKRYCLGDVKYCEGRLHYLGCVNGVETWLLVPPAAQSVAMSTMTYMPTPVVTSTTVTRSQPVVTQSSVTYSQPVVHRSASSRYSMSELRSLIQQYRNHRIYADVQPRSYAYRHLVSDHGFTSDQVNGLSLDEAYRLHSLAHGGILHATRSGASVAMVQSSVQSEPVYSYPVTQQVVNVQPMRTPVRTVIQAAANGCPNGRCPTQRSNAGWSVFGRWR